MDLDTLNIIINDTNYKNFDSKTIKQLVKDKELRRKYLTYYRNHKYYENSREKQLKKSHCDICNCNIVKVKRHEGTNRHKALLPKEETIKEQNEK